MLACRIPEGRKKSSLKALLLWGYSSARLPCYPLRDLDLQILRLIDLASRVDGARRQTPETGSLLSSVSSIYHQATPPAWSLRTDRSTDRKHGHGYQQLRHPILSPPTVAMVARTTIAAGPSIQELEQTHASLTCHGKLHSACPPLTTSYLEQTLYRHRHRHSTI